METIHEYHNDEFHQTSMSGVCDSNTKGAVRSHSCTHPLKKLASIMLHPSAALKELKELQDIEDEDIPEPQPRPVINLILFENERI